MVLFYDPKDESELSRIEQLLSRAGVEYFLGDQLERQLGAKQVFIAEEDLPTAEALLRDDLERESIETSRVLPGRGSEPSAR